MPKREIGYPTQTKYFHDPERRAVAEVDVSTSRGERFDGYDVHGDMRSFSAAKGFKRESKHVSQDDRDDREGAESILLHMQLGVPGEEVSREEYERLLGQHTAEFEASGRRS